MRLNSNAGGAVYILDSVPGFFRGNDRDVDAERAFIGSTSIAPAASTYAHVQLWNPASSGVTMLIDTVTFTVEAAAEVRFFLYNTALSNLSPQVTNKKVGGASPEGELRTQGNASLLGTTRFATLITEPQGPIEVNFARPIFLPEEKGLIVRLQTVDINLAATWQWREL